MQQSWGGYGFLHSEFYTRSHDSVTLYTVEIIPRCCIFDFSTSTKHGVVQGSGQDRELEVEQGTRIASEQKGGEQPITNSGFLSPSSDAVSSVSFRSNKTQKLVSKTKVK